MIGRDVYLEEHDEMTDAIEAGLTGGQVVPSSSGASIVPLRPMAPALPAPAVFDRQTQRMLDELRSLELWNLAAEAERRSVSLDLAMKLMDRRERYELRLLQAILEAAQRGASPGEVRIRISKLRMFQRQANNILGIR